MSERTTNWPEFFGALTEHRAGHGNSLPYNIMVQLDDRHIDSLAKGMGMMTLPAERPSGASFEAEEWRREYSR